MAEERIKGPLGLLTFPLVPEVGVVDDLLRTWRKVLRGELTSRERRRLLTAFIQRVGWLLATTT